MSIKIVPRLTPDDIAEIAGREEQRLKNTIAAKRRALFAIPVGAAAFGLWFHSFWAGAAFGAFLEILNDLREGN